MRRLLREPELWLLLVLIVLVLHPALTGSTFFFRDIYQLFYPKKLLLAEALQRGTFPLWDPFTNGGQPYVSPANTPFHPSNVLYLLLPPLAAFNAAIVLQVALCGAAAYALARVMRISPRPAFVTGAVYALCGVTLSVANLMPILFALPAIPAVLGFTELFLRHRKRRWLVLATLAAALPFYSGAAETAGMMFVLLMVWLALAAVSVRTKTLLFATIFAGSIGLSLLQIVPAVEMMGQSSRGQSRTYAQFTKWSIDARRLPELLVPHFLGRTDTLVDADYWGSKLEDDAFPYFLSIYFGAPALLMALYAGVAREGSSRRLRIALLIVAACALLLSLGRSNPLFPLIHRLPLVSIFRYPVKALILSLLPIALLAGFGFELVQRTRARRLMATLFASGGVLAVLAALQWSTPFADAFDRVFFMQPLGALTPQLQLVLLHGAIACLASAAAMMLMRRDARSGALLLAAVVALDLAVSAWSVNAWAPRQFYAAPPVAAPAAHAVADGAFHDGHFSTQTLITAPSKDLFWLARRKLEALDDYSASLYGMRVIFHTDYDGLAPTAVTELGAGVDQLPWPIREKIFNAAGVRALVTAEKLPNARLAGRLGVSERSLRLYVFPHVLPVRFVSSAEPVEPRGALARMRSGNFDPDRLLLEQLPPYNNRCTPRAMQVVRRSPEETSVVVDAPCHGYLYFTETFYPGWSARIDGRETPLLRANHAFTAVAVPSGRHVVEKRYRSAALARGALGSAVTLLLLLGGAALHRWQYGRLALRDEVKQEPPG